MKLIHSLALVILILSSCSNTIYYQLITLESEDVQQSDNKYVFQNKNLKLEYFFYEENGLLSFSIENISEDPIYVDWKKSSFILSGEKYDYWIDETQAKLATQYTLYTIPERNPLGNMIESGYGYTDGTIVTSKPEKVTFIPPKSSLTLVKFRIMTSGQYFKMQQSTCDSIPVTENGKLSQFPTCKLTYSKDNSPFTFRNYITYSFTDDFEQELRLDNEFYVSEIHEMPKNSFFKRLGTETSFSYQHRFVAPNKYFLKLDSNEVTGDHNACK